jgi:hypothetical protein
MSVRVRRMTLADVPETVRLKDLAVWNQHRSRLGAISLRQP